ncbi:hypothetical protein ACGTJS_10765 [Faucicola mancuniensis]|uniref:hypothetical protein n=1 Tax=Faucicola mancuniensis TaxID=1309795 RepID=UPI003977665B
MPNINDKINDVKTKYIDKGLFTLIVKYQEFKNYAILQKVTIAKCNGVNFPLSDNEDAMEFAKILQDEIGVTVYISELHRQNPNATAFQLFKLAYDEYAKNCELDDLDELDQKGVVAYP